MYAVAKLTRAEYADYLQHLLDLDKEARYRRFATFVRDEVIAEHVRQLTNDDAVFGCYAPGPRLVGAAVVKTFERQDGTREGEIGISVHQDARGKGIGRKLIHRALLWCRTHDVKALHTACITSNQEMANLAKSVGAKLHYSEGFLEGAITLDPCDLSDHMLEVVADNHGMAEHNMLQAQAALSKMLEMAFAPTRFMMMSLPVAETDAEDTPAFRR
jgi:GNAT superfamily N-acetyltransferase